MPYILKHDRPRLDAALAPLIAIARTMTPGEINYCLTRFVKAVVGSEPSYGLFALVLGALAAVQAEFYRTEVAPYEDQKRRENGDVL